MKKRILLTGSAGMLGSNIINEIGEKYEITGIDISNNPKLSDQILVDLSDSERLRAGLDKLRPACVVHCAALTNVDLCEEEPDLAYRTNAVAVKNLISLLPTGIRFIYISTDSIFDGEKGYYSESDITHPVNNYAKTKLEGEYVTQELASNHVIIRTNIFGHNYVTGQSFAEWILDSLLQGKQISMFTDVLFSPISVITLAHLIDRLINMDIIGKVHIGSDSSISKYEFGIKLAKIFSLDHSLIQAATLSTFQLKAKRPKNTTLDITKAKNIFKALPCIDDEINTFYKRIAHIYRKISVCN